MTDIELLNKEPLQEDFIKIFHSSSSHYDVIGKGLGVIMTRLIEMPYEPSNKLILVFQKWRDSNNDVTWKKVLKVCEDYPNELQDAHTKLIQFLRIAEADISRIFSLEKEQMIHNSITDKELLKKEPLQKDLIRIIHSLSQASFHYALIGTGLGVYVRDLKNQSSASLVDKFFVVIQRWKASNKNVTWGKFLKVCEDYPNQLGRAKAELIKFLSSKEKQTIYDSITEELLKKELLPEDLERLVSFFSEASFNYAIIGVDKDVTWGNILKVCKDYPDELGRAKAELIIKFLSSKEELVIHDSNDLLKKEPLPEDFIRIILPTDASFHYAIIGVGLGLNVRDLIVSRDFEEYEMLIEVFQRWRDSNNNVTWEKFLKVCEDYPKELGKAKEKFNEFILSEEAKKYLQKEPIHIKNRDAREQLHIPQEDVKRPHTVSDPQYVWSKNYIVLIVIAVLAVIIIPLFMKYNSRQNN